MIWGEQRRHPRWLFDNSCIIEKGLLCRAMATQFYRKVGKECREFRDCPEAPVTLLAPPLPLELAMPFLPTSTLLDVAVCSWGSLGMAQELGAWNERAILDFGIELPGNSGAATSTAWSEYLSLVRQSLAARRTTRCDAAVWRELCGLRLAHYSLQCALRMSVSVAPGVIAVSLPRTVAEGQPLLLPVWVATAVAASVPLLPLASACATWIVSGCAERSYQRLSPEAQRRMAARRSAGPCPSKRTGKGPLPSPPSSPCR